MFNWKRFVLSLVVAGLFSGMGCGNTSSKPPGDDAGSGADSTSGRAGSRSSGGMAGTASSSGGSGGSRAGNGSGNKGGSTGSGAEAGDEGNPGGGDGSEAGGDGGGSGKGGAGRGGSGGTGGSGTSGDAGSASVIDVDPADECLPSITPEVVNENGFDSGAPPGNWLVDNAAGVQAGAAAVETGHLQAGDSRTFTFDCDGKKHTQLSFYLKAGGSNTRLLDFKVDGVARETFVGDGAWRQQIVDVGAGKHTYTFTASSTQDTDSVFQLDSFSCKYREPCGGPNGNVSFDLAFVPPEAMDDGGEWFVGNSQGAQSGEAAISAPNMKAGDKKAFSFSCNGREHTQLSFFLKAAGSNTRQLTFKVDGNDREVMVGDGAWRPWTFDVPQGKHTYEFIASTTENTSSPFQLDTFLCKNVEPEPAPNGVVSFDLGYIPVEALDEGGQWFVGNSGGSQAGEAAILAPNMKAGDTKSFEFKCGIEHTQLSFHLKAAGSNTRKLTFNIDGKEREVMVGDGAWRPWIFDVPQGDHTYEFSASTGETTASPFQLDSFVCKNVDPVPAVNGNVNFDLGFIALEATDDGGQWFVGNAQGAQAGEGAIYAPNMKAGDKRTFTFDCGAEHTQVGFYLKAAGSNTRQLKLKVDGKEREVFVGDGAWRYQLLDVPLGSHSYEFAASTTENSVSPFQLDSFVCKKVEPSAGPNGNVSFDLGFIPPEAQDDGGDWFVGNTQGVQAGEAAISAPNMKASETKTFTFDCGGVAHQQLTFFLKAAGSNTRELKLSVDGAAPQSFVGDGAWRSQVINTQSVTTHTYEFTATTGADTPSPFQLDTFVCGTP